MKRFFLTFVFPALALSLYADGLFNVTVDAVADIFYVRNYSGDYANKEQKISGSPYRYQGLGIMNSFQSSAFDDGIKGRVGFAYADEKLGGSIELRMTNDTSYLEDWAWSGWIKFGPWFDTLGLRLLAGNTGQNGSVDLYSNFDGFLKGNIGGFGILYPVWRKNGNYVLGNNFNTISNFPYGYGALGDYFGFVQFYGTETCDLFMPAGDPNRKMLNILADITFTPITLTLATGGLLQRDSTPSKTPWDIIIAEDTTRVDYYDKINDPLSNGGMNFAVRAESAKIADVLNIAAVYKYDSSFIFKEIPGNTTDQIDEKATNHAYGLYANVTPLPGLGISVGYSGLYQTNINEQYKNTKPSASGVEEDHPYAKYREVKFPLYHGIDLRFCYTGMEKLTITFNNNMSFADAKGLSANDADNRGLFSQGWAFTEMLNKDPNTGIGAENRSENYLGVFNALSIRYAVKENLNAEISATNQLGIFTLDWEYKSVIRSSNYTGIYAGAGCTVLSNAGFRGSVRGGLDFRFANYAFQLASGTTPVAKAGFFEFGIPVSFKVEY